MRAHVRGGSVRTGRSPNCVNSGRPESAYNPRHGCPARAPVPAMSGGVRVPRHDRNAGSACGKDRYRLLLGLQLPLRAGAPDWNCLRVDIVAACLPDLPSAGDDHDDQRYRRRANRPVSVSRTRGRTVGVSSSRRSVDAGLTRYRRARRDRRKFLGPPLADCVGTIGFNSSAPQNRWRNSRWLRVRRCRR